MFSLQNAGLDHATGHFQLMGGSVEDLGNKMLGIDDGVHTELFYLKRYVEKGKLLMFYNLLK